MIKLKISRTYHHKLKVYERPDRPGNWIADYYLPPQQGEEQVRQRYKVPARNKEQSRRWEAHKRVALDNLEFDEVDYAKMGIDPNDDPDNLTLRDFLPEFRRFRDYGRKRPLSPRTIDSQEKLIRGYFLKTVGSFEKPVADYRLAEITRRFIQDFAEVLQFVEAKGSKPDHPKYLAPKSIENILGVLGRILTVAVDREKLEGRPKVDMPPDSREPSDKDALTLDETQRLWDACKGQYGRVIRMVILTGLRVMELAGVMWEDYDEHAIGIPILQVRRQYYRYGRKNDDPQFLPPKCGSIRIIPVREGLRQVLSEQKAETRLQDGLIFLTENGRPLCNELIRKALHRTCRRAGIRRVSPHTLRRTFVSQTDMACGNLEAVGKLAGQKEIRVTRDHYNRIEMEYLGGVLDQLDERLFGASPNGVTVNKKSENRGR